VRCSSILHDADPAALDDELKRRSEALQAAYVRASGAFEEMSPTLDGDVLFFTHEQGRMRLDELHRTLEEQQRATRRCWRRRTAA
jgi:hypothetical protein